MLQKAQRWLWSHSLFSAGFLTSNSASSEPLENQARRLVQAVLHSVDRLLQMGLMICLMILMFKSHFNHYIYIKCKCDQKKNKKSILVKFIGLYVMYCMSNNCTSLPKWHSSCIWSVSPFKWSQSKTFWCVKRSGTWKHKAESAALHAAGSHSGMPPQCACAVTSLGLHACRNKYFRMCIYLCVCLTCVFVVLSEESKLTDQEWEKPCLSD